MIIIIVLFLKQTVIIKATMDGQKCCFRIMQGHKARAKAMKIAVGISGNKITMY